jgi:hypothetical protein
MHELYLERRGRFVFFPVLHHSYEFALAAVAAFELVQPAAVALEYPHLLRDLILKGIDRLPRVSVVAFGDHEKRYVRIEPVDAFVEVARLAGARGLKVECTDLCATSYPDIADPLPDPYSVARVGHRKYCEMLLHNLPYRPAPEDDARERAMAYHLQQLPGTGTVLILCGLMHLQGLLDSIEQQQPQPFEKKLPARLYHLSSSSLGEIMGTFPFLTSIYELQRTGSRTPSPEPRAPEPKPDPSQSIRVLKGDQKLDLSGFAQQSHKAAASGVPDRDRYEILKHYLLSCRAYYEHEIGDSLSPSQISILDRFMRKYAHIKGMLLPDFFELLIAGRGAISSHFCYRMWEIGTHYEPQTGPSEIEILELRAEDMFQFVNKVRMNPNAPLRPRSPIPRFLKRRDKQRESDQDMRFSPFSICSFQPEDSVIEGYGQHLRSKGKAMLSEERKRVRPFETSLFDGIDIRETVRNWHTGNLYVQECTTVRGQVDSLVVIFDEDSAKYPYNITWLGEHHQESDMAFYATDPQEREVGPGIRKAIYGGFLMTMPPGRLFDVFADPSYRFAKNHAERLLLAAIDYSLERFVMYAAPHPPRPAFQVIAGRYGKRILYIPLAQLSPVMVQRVRTFHVLAEKSVRGYAGQYIW